MFKFQSYSMLNINVQKCFLPILFLLLFGTSITAQSYRVAVIPQGTSKFGYADLEGNITLTPAFFFCSEYTADGTCVVAKNAKYKKCQLFDRDGKEIISAIEAIRIPLPGGGWGYGYPDGYTNGMLVVYTNGKWGALNSKGKLVVVAVFDVLTSFEDGHAIGEKDDKFYLVTKTGKFTQLPPEIKITHAWHFSEGLAAIEVKGQKYGFIDTLGNVAIEPQFTKVGYFSGNYAWARDSQNDIGFINKNGDWAIEPQFTSSRDFDAESGMCMVKKGYTWGYVDISGKFHRFEVMGENVYSFSNGLAMCRKEGKIGFINNKGEWAIEPIYHAAAGFKNGFARVEKDNGKGWGLIDKEGNWVLEPKYRKLGDVSIITD